MNFSPKLKNAMAQVEKVLKEHDIAGIVVLHTPGFGEFKVFTEASYSLLSADGNKGYRLRYAPTMAKDIAEKNELKAKLTKTLNMVKVLSDNGGAISLGLMDLHDQLSKKLDIEHTGGKWTFDDEIYN